MYRAKARRLANSFLVSCTASLQNFSCWVVVKHSLACLRIDRPLNVVGVNVMGIRVLQWNALEAFASFYRKAGVHKPTESST